MYQGLGLDIAAVMPQALATGLFVSLCTIRKPDDVFGESGAPSGTYVDVPGLTNIKCMMAPDSVDRFSIEADETKKASQIESDSWFHVLLERFVEELGPDTNWGNDGWVAVVDGQQYDLIGAENDSQFTQTRLSLRLTSV